LVDLWLRCFRCGACVRPDWHQTWMDVAFVVARRATCNRRSVGAVLVSPRNFIIGTGYNGSPQGLPHCTDVGCLMQEVNGRPSCRRTIHAEINAVLNAGRSGSPTEGSTIFTTTMPCLACSMFLVQAGIVRVVAADDYPDSGEHVLQQAGVEIVRYTVTA
jgi:dCMP deaminase